MSFKLHWYDVLKSELGIDWIEGVVSDIPFSLGCTDSLAPVWKVRSLTKTSATQWHLIADESRGIEAHWYLSVFRDSRAAECHGEFRNTGRETLKGIFESRTMDATWLVPKSAGEPVLRTFQGVRFVPSTFPVQDFRPVDTHLVHTPASWVGYEIGDDDLGRTSAKNLPFAILCNQRQTRGLAFAYEWSGMWKMRFYQASRPVGSREYPWTVNTQAALSGINLDLEPGQTIPMPNMVLTAFKGDLFDGGNSLRRHIRRHIAPSLNGQEVIPPVSFNHWFAFGNDFTADSLKPAVDACGQAGAEYFCVDAAWFQGDFRAGIGNWDVIDQRKFPQGIRAFSDYVASRGMRYGSWFEPEWAHEESQIYRAHPEWFLRSPSQYPVLTAPFLFFPAGFHMMNFGLLDVQRWWVERLCRAYQEWNLRWVRWDFNQIPRPNWDADEPLGRRGWNQIGHIQGLYRVLDQVIKACPDLLIEQCASGGHRIDIGTVRRGHTVWMNDHTMHSETIRSLQLGLNHVLPGQYANTNLCQSRHNYDDFDFLCHGMGGFGYSGKIWEANKKQFAAYAGAVERFKQYRHVINGDFRMTTPMPGRPDSKVIARFEDGKASATFAFDGRKARLSLKGLSGRNQKGRKV